MSNRCRHLACDIYEYGSCATLHIFEDGRLVGNDFIPGPYDGPLIVVCECGFSRAYSRKRRPKWLQERMKQWLEE